MSEQDQEMTIRRVLRACLKQGMTGSYQNYVFWADAYNVIIQAALIR